MRGSMGTIVVSYPRFPSFGGAFKVERDFFFTTWSTHPPERVTAGVNARIIAGESALT